MKALGGSLWCCCCFVPLALCAGWMVDAGVVDDSADDGFYSAIALTTGGVAHIAYYDATQKDMKHAVRNGSGGSASGAVDSAGDVGSHCSIAVDSGGTPHLSYQYRYQQSIPYPPYSVTRGELKYVAGTDGTPVTLDSTTGQIGQYTAIALAGDGAPRIAYQSVTISGNALKYIAKTGGVWGSPQTVENGGAAASMALDANGYPHVAHVSGTSLRYVFWNGSAWTAETIEDFGVEDDRTAIALDASGHPHIAFVTTDGLIYAFHDGSEWTFETVHNVAGMGALGTASPALVLNSSDEPFISYHGTLWGETAVVVAVRTDVDEWQFPAWLLQDTTPGGQTGIAIDNRDVLHVSFHDDTAGALGYASVMPDADNDWLPDGVETGYNLFWDSFEAGEFLNTWSHRRRRAQ
jgi:hypothetical protein